MLRQVASSSSTTLRRHAAASSSCSSLARTAPCPARLLAWDDAVLPPPQWKHPRLYSTSSGHQSAQTEGGKGAHQIPPSSLAITHTSSPSKRQRGAYSTRETLATSTDPTQGQVKAKCSTSSQAVSSKTQLQSRVSSSSKTKQNQPDSAQYNHPTGTSESKYDNTDRLPSTQPESVALAEKKTLTTRIKGFYAQVKFLFQFYLNGVKQIWRDRKRVIAIRHACKVEGGRQQSWVEAKLVRTHTKDLKKLPLFLAILFILEEVLPLIVIYAPFLLPSTCILPSQTAKIRQSEEVKRANAIEALRNSRELQELMDLAGLPLKGSVDELKERLSMRLSGGDSRQAEALKRWRTLGKDNLLGLSRVFCLPTLARPSIILRSNLESHLLFLSQDDVMLSRATSTRSSAPSPYEADSVSFTPAADLPLPTTSSAVAAEVLSERGLRASGADHAEMKRTLLGWLDLVSLLDQATPSASTSSGAQHKPAQPSLSLRRILLPLSLYPPPSLFTPSLREMNLREEREQGKGIIEKSKIVVNDVVEARKEEVKREKVNKADQVGTS